MNKLDNLFIRACKADDPMTRLVSVHRRMYLVTCSDPFIHIKHILCKLCMKYDVVGLDRFIDSMCPTNNWMYGPVDLDFNEKTVRVLMTALRLSSMKKFPDTYRKPACFRKGGK